MDNITFVVDSGSDYESYLAHYFHYPIRVVPLHVNIDGKEYMDGVNITKNAFYKEMNNAKNLPKTSQPTPQQFFEVFKEELDKGNQILFVGISSKLSGTYQSAVIAKDLFSEEEKEKIFLVDSLNVSVTILLILIKANEILLEGTSLPEAVKELNSYKKKVTFLALLDTLENLKKGGRLSTAQAAIGGLLNIKPLITIENGLVITVAKFRGRKKGLEYLCEQLKDQMNKINKFKLFVAHNYLDEKKIRDEVHQMDFSQFKEIVYSKLGATIGTHAGVNTIGFAFVNNE